MALHATYLVDHEVACPAWFHMVPAMAALPVRVTEDAQMK